MEGVFPQYDQTYIPSPAEAIEAAPIDVASTFSAPPPVHIVTPKPLGMPLSVMMISQAAWNEVMIKLAMLTTKVGHMKGRVRSWMDRQFEAQYR